MESTNQTRGASQRDLRRRPRVLIVGLGNDLLMDDGVGVHAARALKRKNLGSRVMVVDVGTAVLEALHLFECADYILAIDAMEAGGAPGTVYRLTAQEAEMRERASMHDFTFQSALTLLAKQPVRVDLIGVEPEQIDYGLELTPAAQNSIPAVCEAVAGIVKDWMASSQPRFERLSSNHSGS